MGKKAVASAAGGTSASTSKSGPASGSAGAAAGAVSNGNGSSSKAPKPGAKVSKEVAKSGASGGVLAAVRPAPRWIFFLLFLVLCVGMLFLHDQCDVKGKKRDCGYAGVTPSACRTVSCLTKGGKGFEKKTVKVAVEGTSTLGFTVKRKDGKVLISQVEGGGAVAAHNAAVGASSEDALSPEDEVKKISVKGRSWSNAADIEKALKKSDFDGPVEVEVMRSRLPAVLRWLHSKTGQPNWAERILTAPGTQHFASLWGALGTMGAATWFISGYPAASLPLYTLLSGGVAFELTRCCHDSEVASGQPHCYKSKRETLSAVAMQAWESVAARARAVAADPRSYVNWLTHPAPLKL